MHPTSHPALKATRPRVSGVLKHHSSADRADKTSGPGFDGPGHRRARGLSVRCPLMGHGLSAKALGLIGAIALMEPRPRTGPVAITAILLCLRVALLWRRAGHLPWELHSAAPSGSHMAPNIFIYIYIYIHKLCGACLMQHTQESAVKMA